MVFSTSGGWPCQFSSSADDAQRVAGPVGLRGGCRGIACWSRWVVLERAHGFDDVDVPRSPLSASAVASSAPQAAVSTSARSRCCWTHGPAGSWSRSQERARRRPRARISCRGRRASMWPNGRSDGVWDRAARPWASSPGSTRTAAARASPSCPRATRRSSNPWSPCAITAWATVAPSAHRRRRADGGHERSSRRPNPHRREPGRAGGPTATGRRRLITQRVDRRCSSRVRKTVSGPPSHAGLGSGCPGVGW